MSAEHIDHAAEAQTILDDINNAGLDDNLPMDWAGATTDEQWLVNASHAQAQVHATLALVEQQRIANLIALAGQRIEYDETTALFTDMGMALRMRQQAFEGLGL